MFRYCIQRRFTPLTCIAPKILLACRHWMQTGGSSRRRRSIRLQLVGSLPAWRKRQAVTSAPLHISTSHTSTRSVLRTPHLTHCQLSICHISANCGRIRPAHRLTRMLGAPSWYMGALLGVRVEGCQSGVCTRYAAERLLRREWCSLDMGSSD